MSHTGLCQRIVCRYHDRTSEIKQLFKHLHSEMHISCDLWTSTFGLSLLGIVAHFLDAAGVHHTVLLGLPRLWGGHTGVNIAECMLAVTAKYGIQSQLGCFVMDNASNNNTMMDAIETALPGIRRNMIGSAAWAIYSPHSQSDSISGGYLGL